MIVNYEVWKRLEILAFDFGKHAMIVEVIRKGHLTMVILSRLTEETIDLDHGFCFLLLAKDCIVELVIIIIALPDFFLHHDDK